MRFGTFRRLKLRRLKAFGGAESFNGISQAVQHPPAVRMDSGLHVARWLAGFMQVHNLGLAKVAVLPNRYRFLDVEKLGLDKA